MVKENFSYLDKNACRSSNQWRFLADCNITILGLKGKSQGGSKIKFSGSNFFLFLVCRVFNFFKFQFAFKFLEVQKVFQFFLRIIINDFLSDNSCLIHPCFRKKILNTFSNRSGTCKLFCEKNALGKKSPKFSI